MIKGNLVNVFTEEIYPAEIEVKNGIITCLREIKGEYSGYILPGFIDSHIHIESSMLTPSRFAEAVVPHGTTAVVADPHEIANVMGVEGIKYMMKDAATTPLQVFFTASSCVPATPFETSGAILGPDEIDTLMDDDQVVALGEMMNFPGVIGNDPVVLEKIKIAQKHRKPVDGHAPLLSGKDLCDYIGAGISTDHECTQLEEAHEKKGLGMKIMIREGSSAHNLEELISVGGEFLVSDDRDPEDLLNGHIDQILKKAVHLGMDPVDALRMVTLNPAEHYNLSCGGLKPGSPADMVLVDDLENFKVDKVWIKGKLVSQNGAPLFQVDPLLLKSTFRVKPKKASDFEVNSPHEEEKVRVIDVIEGQLLTSETEAVLRVVDGHLQADTEKDILKIAVVERYGHDNVSNAFIRGFLLKNGAIASSVAHDSHNIIVVGTNCQDMAEAVNILSKNNGGIVVVSDGDCYSLKLPIAGLMSTESAEDVSSQLSQLHKIVKDIGCELASPFMTMSFMALLVIPKLKISDQGLFDVENFQFVDVIK
ncbi:adenine deaminase [Methanobacterium petrolearium]|uniref:adenine deaminase n=1 Tax=Methanobacterium petrolearium TaxID=710190 RepID=UPI001AE42931|nr:adenine deaminase [Methanobacterium petrolearium]MBP1946389.1 adenine deaminase [Methanobacterium petrolearium]